MSNVLFNLNGLNAYEHVPAVTTKLPVLVMFPGKGEISLATPKNPTIDPVSEAPKVLINGPSKFINDGWNPQDLIVVSVQPTAEWMNPEYVDNIVNAVLVRYKDKSDGRLFLTGLSAGGYAIENYIGKDPAYSNKVTAIVTMSDPEPEKYYNPANFTQPAWGFCGTADSWYNKMKARFATKKFTSYAGGHSGWNAMYHPAYKENGLSIYDFLKAQKGQTTTQPSTEVPAKEVNVVADKAGIVYGSAKTFNILPGDTLVLSGNYLSFYLKDLNGTAENPITVECTNVVTIGGYKAYSMIFENSSYVNVVGTNQRGKLVIDGSDTGTKSPGIALNKCHHFSIKGSEITRVSAGFMAKTTPKDETPGTYETATDTFSYDTIIFESNWVHDITGEGTYIGCSTSTLIPVSIGGVVTQVYAYRVKNSKVINNVFENTGWDGIQLTCGDNIEISGNTVKNYGTALVGYQGYGIICAANSAKILHNTVENGTATGITGSFNGYCEIAYNRVINAYGELQDAIYANAHAIKDYDKFKPYIHDNYVEKCKRNAIRVANTDGFEVPGVIENNRFKDSMMVVDESGSLLTNNVEVKDPTEPPTPSCPHPVSILMSDGTSVAVGV